MSSHDIAGHETIPGPFFPTADGIARLPAISPILTAAWAPIIAVALPLWQFQMSAAMAFMHGFADTILPPDRVDAEDCGCAALTVPEPIEEDGEHALFA